MLGPQEEGLCGKFEPRLIKAKLLYAPPPPSPPYRNIRDTILINKSRSLFTFGILDRKEIPKQVPLTIDSCYSMLQSDPRHLFIDAARRF